MDPMQGYLLHVYASKSKYSNIQTRIKVGMRSRKPQRPEWVIQRQAEVKKFYTLVARTPFVGIVQYLTLETYQGKVTYLINGCVQVEQVYVCVLQEEIKEGDTRWANQTRA